VFFFDRGEMVNLQLLQQKNRDSKTSIFETK